jgi:alpha-glucosidase
MRGIGLAAALVALLGTGVAHAAAPDAVLDAGSLRAEVRAEPFGVAFVDPADGDRLDPASGAGGLDRYSALGFAADIRQATANNAYFGYEIGAEVELPWFAATRLLGARREGDDGRLVMDVATSDPGGTRLEVVLERAAEGAVRLRSRPAPGSGPLAGLATASGAAFLADTTGDERFLGFGSRSNAVDQTGGRVFNWAEEGPFSSGEAEALMRPLLPDFTFPTGPTGTNLPIPWTVTTRGLGVLIETPHRSHFDLRRRGREEAWRVEAEAPSLDLVVVGGPEPRDVVRRYSAFAGRQPRPAGWLLGPWVQFHTGRDTEFVRDDIPTSVSQTYTHYLPCGAGRDTKAERARVQRAHDLGMKITTYFNPHVCTSYRAVYDEAARRGLFVKNPLGQPYLLTNPFTADQLTSGIDFTNPEGRALYRRLIDEALDNGYDGWMEDFGEYTPTDARLHDGTTGLESHNPYTVAYHCTSTEHTKKRRGADLAVFVRSGYHGIQPCARAVWGGDPTEDWSCADGLCAAVHQLLNMGLSGVAYQGSDIGGFHAIANPRADDELTVRWAQVGFASGVMRTQANGYSFLSDRSRRSQVWSPAVKPIWRRYAKLRTQLFPYLAAASAEYQRSGMPIARHLSLAWPRDRATSAQHDTFLLGPDLLVAPVLRPDARERRLHVPPGEWVDLWRSTTFDEGPGALRPDRVRLVEGGRDATLPAPLEELPLLVRAGAVLPLTSPDVDTLATLGDDRTVALHERRRRLHLLAFPRGTWTGRFYGRTDGRLRSVEDARGWRLTVISSRTRTVTLQAATSGLRRPFRPCRVTVGGRTLRRSAWAFDRDTGALRATFRAVGGRRGGTVLRAHRRC